MNYGPTTYQLDEPDGTQMLEVVVTEEGVIMDCYRGAEHVGTIAMMADEWYDFVIVNDPMNNISE